MLLLVCAILPLIGGTLAGPLADQYFDNLIHSVLPGQVKSNSLDPAPLSDFRTEFKDKMALIGTVKGHTNFTKCQLTGLSKGTRLGPCGGPVYKFGQPSVNCTLFFQDLHVGCEGKTKYGKMPIVSIKGKANVTTTSVFVEVTSQIPQPTVSAFHFVQIGQLNSKFTGLGSALNKFLKPMEDSFKANVGSELVNSISQKYRWALERSAAQLPVPR